MPCAVVSDMYAKRYTTMGDTAAGVEFMVCSLEDLPDQRLVRVGAGGAGKVRAVPSACIQGRPDTKTTDRI